MRSAIVCVVLFTCQVAFANCSDSPDDGRVVTIEAVRCEAIAGERNREVATHAGPAYEIWNLKKAYTGALITDVHGGRWMYPSPDRDPCARFPRNARVSRRAYFTCCDTGRWGKCVFGGQWLGDVDGPRVNAFQ